MCVNICANKNIHYYNYVVIYIYNIYIQFWSYTLLSFTNTNKKIMIEPAKLLKT